MIRLLFGLGIIVVTACSPSVKTEETRTEPATSVTLTHIRYGNIPEKLMLSATTAYLSKTSITAPVPTYVTKVYVQPGDRVRVGQPLFDLESKEQHTLSFPDMPPIVVRAGTDGIVLEVFGQAGNYTAEDTILCTFATDFVFLLDVPYEVSRHVTSGESCSLVLPDGTYLPATIGEPLATVDAVSQTQPVRLFADAPPLPEGMRLKAVIRVNGNEELKMLLPKAAVQSDETLTSYWVMKLIDDSTAVRVPVETGNSTADSMEVFGPLVPADRIVLTGGYALADSSKIIISHE